MPVLIVSKTRMHAKRVCVGGFDLRTRRNVRLLTAQGSNQPESTDFEVGDVWDVEYIPKRKTIPPHLEDVNVQGGRQIGVQGALSEFLRQNVPIVGGGLSHTFDGLLRFTGSGSGYIARSVGIPEGSVGFWEPDVVLNRDDFNEKVRYRFWEGLSERHISFVGLQTAPDHIEPGTLLRLSLEVVS